MKKVLLISDGESFPQCAFDYARMLHDSEPILLTGLFLPPMNYILSLSEAGSIAAGLPLPENYIDVAAVRQVIDRFKAACAAHGIECRVHSEHTSADTLAGDIRLESRFADLLLMGNMNMGDTPGADIQDEAIHMVLRHAECPVLIAPCGQRPVERVVVAYDGSSSSVHALKQFIYLFPDYTNKDTEIIYADTDEEQDFPALAYLKEFAGRHFARLVFTKINIDPRKYFDTWFMEKRNALLVTGSGSRSWISQLLKKNFIDSVIEDRQGPIFTAHR